MNGVHDLGGMHGFGPVVREEHEPVFHAEWEKSVFAISQAVRSVHHLFNLDEFRRGIESMDPAHYLAASYYARWLASIESNLVEKGVVTRADLDARTAILQADPLANLPRREDLALAERATTSRSSGTAVQLEPATSPRFAVGDQVVARNVHPAGHTRLPRYVRGRRGVVDHLRGTQTLPDANAHGLGPLPQAVYSVRFDGRALWGDSAEPRETLYIDLWESYLDPA